jgi:peptidoglycan/xylan/chitin deacetylase (PgdA/CDA1 family)
MKHIGFFHFALLIICCTAAGCGNTSEGDNGTAGDTDISNDDAGASTDPQSDISGMPIPPLDEVPVPSGPASNLVILDWAGFKAALTYSFDDLHPSQAEHYDTLQNTGAHMTFFAVNAADADMDTWRKAVEDGHEIGNHTAHHCHAGLSGECAFGTALETEEAEIEECTKYIVENFGQKDVWTMAAPYGETWWGTFIASDYFFLNRSVTDGTIAPNDDSKPLNLPSVMLSGTASASSLIRDIDSVYAEGKWLIFCIHAILPTAFDADWGTDIDIITSSIEHGQSLGDLWIDSMVNVGAYWMGQQVLAAVEPATFGDETVWTWTLPDHFPTGKCLRVKVDGGTLSQNGRALSWSPHGYYEVALDDGVLTLSP